MFDLLVGSLGFIMCGCGIFALMAPHDVFTFRPQKIRQRNMRNDT